MSKRAAEEHKIASIKEQVEFEILNCKVKAFAVNEELTIESVLQELVEEGTFDSIDKKEQIGNIGEYEVKLKYNENNEVVIEYIKKADGVRVTYKLEPVGYTNKAKVNIVIKAIGKVKSLTNQDGLVAYAENGEVTLDYGVTANGTYIFKVENEEGIITDKEVIVDTIDILAPLDFTITAGVAENGDVTITHTARDKESDGNSVCSGIEKIEYYLQKEGETSYTKIEALVDEENKQPYVGEDGVIHNLPTGTHKIYGVAVDKAGNESNQTPAIEVKVKKIVPPEIGETGTTHTAKQLIFDWEELEQLAKKISDNYGEEEGKINSNTAEVAVSINGKSQTIGVGDWATVNGKKVRILGFNHDDLSIVTKTDEQGNEVEVNQYGEGATNVKAGISFEYVDYLYNTTRVHSSSSNDGGWGSCELRNKLNNATLNTLENKEQIKQVQKDYLKTYNNANSIEISNDYLWILSAGEIWTKIQTGGSILAHPVVIEGNQYKYWKVQIGDLSYQSASNKTSPYGDSWLRSLPNKANYWTMVISDGRLGQRQSNTTIYNENRNYMKVHPGFAI